MAAASSKEREEQTQEAKTAIHDKGESVQKIAVLWSPSVYTKVLYEEII